MSVAIDRCGKSLETEGNVQVGLVIWNRRQGRIVADTVVDLGWMAHVIQIDGDLRSTFERNPRIYDMLIFVANHVTDELLGQLADLADDPTVRILTIARDRDAQTIADTLRAGSDDYLRSPFATEELAARLQALISFNVPGVNPVSAHTSLIFDFSTRSIESGQQRVSFSPAEWSVLIALLEQEQRPVTAGDLAAAIEPTKVGSASIPSIVSRIRRRLRNAQFDFVAIETVHRRGYSVRFLRPIDNFLQSEHVGSGPR
jgi:DNA-binding response OmpR family regulator